MLTATRNFGGVARRQTMFDQIRADATVEDKLFIDAGDVFQGTLYFNLYEGRADLDFYNRLGYHAMAVGNHEFDKGDQVLTNFIKGAQFPVLSANISLKPSATSPLAGVIVTGDNTPNSKLGQRTIVTLPSGKKVGIFGLTPPDTALLSSPSKDVVFGQDLAATAQAQVDALKTAGADVIVALTHIGFLADKDLAAATSGIHVIVGGHSHSPLIPDDQNTLPLGVTRVDTYPVVVNGTDSKPVIIVTDWEWAKWVGDMVIGFDAAGNVVEVASPGALNPNPGESDGQIRPVWADGIKPNGRALLAGEEPEIPADPTVQDRIDTEYKPGVDALQNTQFALAGVFLDGERANARSKETNMSDIVADALRNLILARPDFNPQSLPVVTIINGGGIRASIQVGPVTVGGLISVLPFGNTVATVVVSGANLKAALENGVSQVETGAGRFPQVSGLRFLWNAAAAAGKPRRTRRNPGHGDASAGTGCVYADRPSSQLPGGDQQLHAHWRRRLQLLHPCRRRHQPVGHRSPPGGYRPGLHPGYLAAHPPDPDLRAHRPIDRWPYSAAEPVDADHLQPPGLRGLEG